MSIKRILVIHGGLYKQITLNHGPYLNEAPDGSTKIISELGESETLESLAQKAGDGSNLLADGSVSIVSKVCFFGVTIAYFSIA